MLFSHIPWALSLVAFAVAWPVKPFQKRDVPDYVRQYGNLDSLVTAHHIICMG